MMRKQSEGYNAYPDLEKLMRQLRSAPTALVLGLTLLCALAFGQAGTTSLAGLSQPVEIIKDRWGIAHIYARNEQDLFFAQGYNAARDRLF